MKIFASFLLSLSFSFAQAQDIAYNKKIVDTLTSPTFWGRGYTNNGMANAANFLADEFKKIGLQPLTKKGYLQPLTISANTFPGAMEVSINGKSLQPGLDFIVDASSRGNNCKGKLQQQDSVTFIDAENRVIVKLEKKLTWSASQQVEDYTLIQIKKESLSELPKTINVNIENSFEKKFAMANVCAVVPGTKNTKEYYFVSAHYDHLGGMGSKTYFPGANDNASGVALLLSLAKYFAANPQEYNIAFVLFAGEEIGLVGSKFFTEKPLVPLNKIKFLLNTDLAGTGEDGITVVNATEYKTAFDLLTKINSNNQYLKAVNARGKAANSDHYWFSEKGVPAFFFYTLGGITAYHDVFDKAATLPLNEQADLQKLVIAFLTEMQKLN
jgi:aminopeptidase YwaD